MRIGLLLVLLLAASPISARAQDILPRLAPSALPARLMPATDWTARDPVVLDLRRNHAGGAAAGAVVGAFAGVLVANRYVCNVPGEGGAEGICRLAGLGLGIIAGAVVGGIIGLPDASPSTR